MNTFENEPTGPKEISSAPADSRDSGLNRRDFLKGSTLASFMTMLGGVELLTAAEPEEPKKPVNKVKCAVIGLGLWGREIVDRLMKLEEADLVAICDTYKSIFTRVGKSAPNAAQIEDYRKILEDKSISAVIVATPTHQHKEIVLAALQAGKHVYCEAPLANTMEDARAIALAAKTAYGQVFQSGLQTRSDPQRYFLLPFIRSGNLGKPIMARAQWHKKQSWRAGSSSAEREKEINWRLHQATSLGLAGEIGIHHLDQASWFFLNAKPLAITGMGATMRDDKDDRDVADTIHLAVDYPGSVRFTYDCTLANSFDSDYEMYYGSDIALMMRESKAWMFKEVDAPLLGWEVYARKDNFYKETGIALVAGASKQKALSGSAAAEQVDPNVNLGFALKNFLGNCDEISGLVKEYYDLFPTGSKADLGQNLAVVKPRPAANYQDGYNATVIAIKASEAVTKGTRVEMKKEWFELA